MPASMGALQAVLPVGQDETWHAYPEGSSYVLASETGERTLWFSILPEAGAGDRRRFSVEVQVDAVPQENKVVGAGLVFAADRTTGDHYAFLLQPDGSVALMQGGRDKGYRLIMSTSNDSIRPGEFNELEILKQGNRIQMNVNGTSTGTWGSSDVGSGEFGIFAAGAGTFRYSEFEHR